MPMDRRLLAPLIALVLTGLLAGGCADGRQTRSNVQVVLVNNNNPLESDVLKDTGGAGTVVEDAVSIQIRDTASDSLLTLKPNGPYGSVVLDRYDVQFQSDEDIPPVSGTLGWTVHVGETVTGNIVIVPAALKAEPPLVGLDAGGEIQAVAKVTIQGHEANSNYNVTTQFTLQVNFANWTDS